LPRNLNELPSVHALRDPDPGTQAAVVAEAEAVVRDAYVAAQAAVAPSPARAEPHDATAWLPLPDVDELPEVAPEPPPRPPWYRRAIDALPPLRAVLVAVLASVAVLSVAWVGRTLTAPGGSDVTLFVGSGRVDVRTDAATVSGFLALRHVQLGTGDTVSPVGTTRLYDGIRIRVDRAFPVDVDFDGSVRTVMTTARTGDALMKQLHVGKLVALRSDPGSLAAGTSVILRTRHAGSLSLDGKVIQYDSPSVTVAELLDSYSVVLVGDDRVEPDRATRLSDGMAVTVVRVGAETKQDSEVIPFGEVRQPDPTLLIGQTRDVQAGQNGVMTVTYREVTENGAVTGRTVLSKVPAIAPKPHIVAYGTQADWHWDALAQCESGGKWDTIDTADGYDGGLGIYRGTWRAFGGTDFASNAGLATREQQIIVGQRIYDKYGWSAWGCGHTLHWA
jgi:uncharacterized protein YabE (DUF348 family)